MARRGTNGKRVSKEWGSHLKKFGKRIANKAERKNNKMKVGA